MMYSEATHLLSLKLLRGSGRLLYIVTTKYGDVPCGHPYVTVSSTTCIGSLETKLTTYTKPLQQAWYSETEDKPCMKWSECICSRKPGHVVD